MTLTRGAEWHAWFQCVGQSDAIKLGNHFLYKLIGKKRGNIKIIINKKPLSFYCFFFFKKCHSYRCLCPLNKKKREKGGKKDIISLLRERNQNGLLSRSIDYKMDCNAMEICGSKSYLEYSAKQTLCYDDENSTYT